MKRIPFTLEAWKAGGVPVTRAGVYIKQLTWFEGAIVRGFCLFGTFMTLVHAWDITGRFVDKETDHDYDILLEVPCTKYYTHYYRHTKDKEYIETCTNQDPNFIEYTNYTHIKTVEVEL